MVAQWFTAGVLASQLRDGDWRARKASDVASGDLSEDDTRDGGASGIRLAQVSAPHGLAGEAMVEEEAEEEEEEEEKGADVSDGRLEGTAAYLSPELVRGGQPTEASDLWALGCTMYQALCGKPPVWAESQEEIMRKIVRFEQMATDRFPESLPTSARGLIAALMQPQAEARLVLPSVQLHPFFDGLQLTTLYEQVPPPLSQGIAAPAPHASWTRRQNSMMWSPLPQRYNFADDAIQFEPVLETELEANALFTGTPAAVPLCSVDESSQEGPGGGSQGGMPPPPRPLRS